MRGSLSILACMGCLLDPARVLMYGVVPTRVNMECNRKGLALRSRQRSS